MVLETMRFLPIEVVPKVATILWPRFLEHDGLVFVDLPGCSPGRGRYQRRPDVGMDNTGIEAFSSHIHLLNLFEHDRKAWRSRTLKYDRRRRDFRLAEQIGLIVAQTWFAKLQHDFPQHHFRVYYTRDDEPTVRFHRIYAGEVVCMDDPSPRESREGARIVWDTRRLKRKR